MNRLARLEQLLRAHFPEAEFELFDDSAAHAGHAHGGARVAGATDGGRQPMQHGEAGETHYRLRIRDASFNGQPLIKIHREILAAIKPETDAGLHSFVIEKAEPS
jgi:BolA protein